MHGSSVRKEDDEDINIDTSVDSLFVHQSHMNNKMTVRIIAILSLNGCRVLQGTVPRSSGFMCTKKQSS